MKSRMMGDYQVRFCERLGVKYPGLLDKFAEVMLHHLLLNRKMSQQKILSVEISFIFVHASLKSAIKH